MKDEDALTKRFLPRLRRMAKFVLAQYPSVASSIGVDDLVQEGSVGLGKAVERYDPSKGKLETYAHPWIRGEMMMAVRREATNHRYEWEAAQAAKAAVNSGPELADAVLGIAEEYAVVASSQPCSPEDAAVTNEKMASIREFTTQLSDRHREFFRLRIVEGLSLEEIVLVMGSSGGHWSRVEARLRQQLRLHLASR